MDSIPLPPSADSTAETKWERYKSALNCKGGPWVAWGTAHLAMLVLAVFTAGTEFLLMEPDPPNYCETQGGWLCFRYVPGLLTLFGLAVYAWFAAWWAAFLAVTVPVSYRWPQTLKWRSWLTLVAGAVAFVAGITFFVMILVKEL